MKNEKRMAGSVSEMIIDIPVDPMVRENIQN